jgi:hypothetical protein
MNRDDLVRFRLWNFIVPVCCDAELAFEKFEQAGLLIMLLKDVNSKDSLIATNAVSLVAAVSILIILNSVYLSYILVGRYRICFEIFECFGYH